METAEGRDGWGRGCHLLGEAPAHSRGASATVLLVGGCGWLLHELAGEDWGRAGVNHRDREGCLHTSFSTL